MRKTYQKQFHRQTGRSSARQRGPAAEDAVQLTLDRAEVLRQMQEGLHGLGVSLGLELAALMIEDEVGRLLSTATRN